MTREQAEVILSNVSSKGLFSAIVFYYSPITEAVEERHIYADDNCECIIWADARLQKFKEYNMPCIVYVNNSVHQSYRAGDIFKQK